jgi:hypothetical protein
LIVIDLLLLLLLLLQGGLREVLARQRVALEGARLLVLNAAEALDRWAVGLQVHMMQLAQHLAMLLTKGGR